jgi:predicted Zn-dependent protease
MGDPELARGVLRSTLAVDPITSKNLGSAFQTSEWLLRLTQTNRADLELVCEVYDKAQLYELVAAQLKPIADSLSGSLKTIYVKTLFFLSELQQYNELWNELSPSEQVRPDMALIRAGYLAGWGEVGVVAEAQAALNKAAEERGPLWLLANRLQMAISALRLDPERYAESLRRLQETQMDAGVEHAAYWSLLASSGRKAEAVRLAREFATPPRNPSELARLAEVNVQLGLKEEGLKLMRAFANYFPLSEPVWTIYAQMLLDAQDWEGLRGAALHMRQFAAFRGQLDALSHFYEGRADLGSGRVEAARQAFEKASEAEFRTPGQSILAASSLLGLGYPAQARAILERAEGMVTNRLQYLDLMSRAAILTKDGPLLLTTGQAAYELQPANVEYANRYAAGLLIQAERPAEAVRLTLELTTKFPNSETFRINHALALLLNRRPEEAEKALGRVSFGHLRPDELNAYYQAMFELKFQQRDYSQAWQNLDRLDWNQLFPNETNRLGQMRALLPPRSVSAPAPSA